jgi:hypothetical protein
VTDTGDMYRVVYLAGDGLELADLMCPAGTVVGIESDHGSVFICCSRMGA